MEAERARNSLVPLKAKREPKTNSGYSCNPLAVDAIYYDENEKTEEVQATNGKWGFKGFAKLFSSKF